MKEEGEMREIINNEEGEGIFGVTGYEQGEIYKVSNIFVPILC